MTEDDFIKLSSADAKNHILGQSKAEADRLAVLYRDRHGIDLWRLDKNATAAEPGTIATVGWWLFGLGLIGALAAFFYPVGVETPGLYGVPDQVANLDKIAIRHMVMAASLAVFVAGSVLIGAGAVQRDLRRLA